MRPSLVILDRDGVINFDSPDYIKSAEEWVPVPGSIDAIARLHRAGIQVFVATNQAGIARGKLTETSLAAIHEKMCAAVEDAGGALDGIEYCPHHPDDECTCRKPQPGMLLRISEISGIGLKGQYFVGDSLKDIRAAEAAGCNPVLVLTGNGAETRRSRPSLPLVFDDLAAFVDAILED